VAAYTRTNGIVGLDGLPPGRYRVVVQCPQAIALEEVVDVDDEPVTSIWSVDPGLSLHGTVENARGEPVSRAMVSVTSVDGGLAKAGASCTTAADGHFTCSGLSPGVYDCSVDQDRDPNRQVVRVSVREGSSETVLLRTRPSGTIRVAFGGGADVASRPLRVLARGEVTPVPIEAAPSEHGFIFRLVPLGRYDVYADAGEGQQNVQLEHDGQVIELRLDAPDEAFSIRGRVLDEGGLPVVDAWVSAARSDLELTSSANELRTLTDEDGNFAVHEITRGTYRIHVWTTTGEGEVRAVAAGATDVVVHVESQI
jgi:protocatechuate 3,4-dioxygenase beta subunit